MQATSKPNDICLIPFCGSGTDCVAAKMLNRNFIAFETDKHYVSIAKKRIKCIEEQKNIFDNNNDNNKRIVVSVDENAMRERMKLKNIDSITELAIKSEVSKPKIHQYLRGDSPLATTFIRLCEYLNVEPNEVLKVEEQKMKDL